MADILPSCALGLDIKFLLNGALRMGLSLIRGQYCFDLRTVVEHISSIGLIVIYPKGSACCDRSFALMVTILIHIYTFGKFTVKKNSVEF